MDLIDHLNALGSTVNSKYPKINYGGCAVFASIVGQELLKMGVHTSIIVGGDRWTLDGADIDKARTKVNNIGKKTEWRDNGIGFGHLGLEFYWKRKKYHYDSNGAHKPGKKLDGVALYKGRFTVEECTAVANEPEGWNHEFDRKQIPALRRMVKKHFEEMKEQM